MPFPIRVRPFGLLSLALVTGLVSAGCAIPSEEEEEAAQALVKSKTYEVDVRTNTKRYVRIVHRCKPGTLVINTGGGTKPGSAPSGGVNGGINGSATCEFDETDAGILELSLLSHRNAPGPYPATAVGDYKGCGMSAIGNVLNWVRGGNPYTVAGVYSWAGHKQWALPPPLMIFNENQGLTPDDLKSFLQSELSNGDHRYSLQTLHNLSLPRDLKVVTDSLKKGFPVIALVQGGDHWQVITGYKAPDKFHVIDYVWRNKSDPKKPVSDPAQRLAVSWAPERSIADLGFNDLGAKYDALAKFRGLHDGTLIRVNSWHEVPGQTPGAGLGGGDGVACGDSPDSPQCPPGQTLTGACQCSCPANGRDYCQPGQDYNTTTCSCFDPPYPTSN